MLSQNPPPRLPHPQPAPLCHNLSQTHKSDCTPRPAPDPSPRRRAGEQGPQQPGRETGGTRSRSARAVLLKTQTGAFLRFTNGSSHCLLAWGHLSLQSDFVRPHSDPACLTLTPQFLGHTPVSPWSRLSPPALLPWVVVGPCSWGLGLTAAPSADALDSEDILVFVPPRWSLHLTNEETEVQGGRVASPGSRSQSPAEPGHQVAWPLTRMQLQGPQAPGFQPLPQFITCRHTVPIWTHVCSQTSDPVWGFENWVTHREVAVKKTCLGFTGLTPGLSAPPKHAQVWDSGSRLEAKSPNESLAQSRVGPRGPALSRGMSQPSALLDIHSPSGPAQVRTRLGTPQAPQRPRGWASHGQPGPLPPPPTTWMGCPHPWLQLLTATLQDGLVRGRGWDWGGSEKRVRPSGSPCSPFPGG